ISAAMPSLPHLGYTPSANRIRRLNEKPGMYRAQNQDSEKSLSFCHLTKQHLINELEDGVNERHRWPDDSSPDYRPKFSVFTEKADRLWRTSGKLPSGSG